ncbi:LysE/ArgO family amino acid transporter [Vibrio fluvialis]|uniref:LysE/ArgO family amino acid transporter n=1 Tax=Vibrio fluvialis TaxID=676 RepID=UPI001C9CFCCA|nr:LysE/ArgO family amino acid transporter [Vibrio fluvialis]MBY7805521.1 LysE/ArgO family amino acid transporter [Vibrio fluvialis]MBY8106618.1 LysE/ArgO family amino acid transporter [Vibrio fluvialis]MCE7593062.1 LysE/ArgO family amino acid transporter [Vibrio fluvialis]MCE7595496.1 LysE/ArgO family amino acid transporter [Vibrio fluvialis]MCE7595729.1 LysE/ArgO family amino acid transporter [Vibrio fluvialis]
MNFWILLQGFGFGATMIIPIGAQNAYVLNQGIKRNHHLTTATICSFLDIFFISLGIFGGGAILSQSELLLTFVTVGGIAFLTFYGLQSWKSAFTAQSKENATTTTARGRRAVILGTLAVTVLNPHLYLDTVVILGSIGGQFEGNDRLSFAIGTIMASFVWFYSLSIGAAKLAPTLSRPRVKQAIDIGVALMMFGIAIALTKNLYQLWN